MRDDDDGHTEVLVDVLQKSEDFLRRVGVEGAGGLVAEQDLRLRRERAGDGDALALTAGELRGIGIGLVRQTDDVEQLAGAGLVGGLFAAGDLHREADVLQRGALHEQVELLKDHAHGLAHAVELLFGEPREIAPVK